ncbi:hypothetical protein [Nocardioides bigeumensis]|jgi:hypothetical protein|uniref:Uncharacterized protein n=1 Tax=Nocardioides bigeumensis TaxID=433657 RepID=A0ABN2YY96_9ACTN
MFRKNQPGNTKPSGPRNPRHREFHHPSIPVRDRYSAALAAGWRPLG